MANIYSCGEDCAIAHSQWLAPFNLIAIFLWVEFFFGQSCVRSFFTTSGYNQMEFTDLWIGITQLEYGEMSSMCGRSPFYGLCFYFHSAKLHWLNRCRLSTKKKIERIQCNRLECRILSFILFICNLHIFCLCLPSFLSLFWFSILIVWLLNRFYRRTTLTQQQWQIDSINSAKKWIEHKKRDGENWRRRRGEWGKK